MDMCFIKMFQSRWSRNVHVGHNVLLLFKVFLDICLISFDSYELMFGSDTMNKVGTIAFFFRRSLL